MTVKYNSLTVLQDFGVDARTTAESTGDSHSWTALFTRDLLSLVTGFHLLGIHSLMGFVSFGLSKIHVLKCGCPISMQINVFFFSVE